MLCPEIFECFHQVIVKVLLDEDVSQEWEDAMAVVLLKELDQSVRANYRGILLISPRRSALLPEA